MKKLFGDFPARSGGGKRGYAFDRLVEACFCRGTIVNAESPRVFLQSTRAHGGEGGARWWVLGVAAVLSAAPAGAGIFQSRFVDHTLCCGTTGPVGLEGRSVRSGREPGVLAAVSAKAPGAGGGGGAGAEVAGKTAAPGASGSPAAVPVASAAPAAVAPAAGVAPAPLVEVDGHLKVGFDRLADFKITVPGFDPANKPEEALAALNAQIPEALRKLDGRRVQITGFMLPVKFDGTKVTQFLLMRDQMMCCYGVVPQINDWVVVQMVKPVQFTPDTPVSFRGKLRVNAMQENGFLTGVYVLDEGAFVKE